MSTAADLGWNSSDHFPSDDVVIQAHRGPGLPADENTLAAFERGWSLDRNTAKLGRNR
jgi:hypothetical protein